MRVAHIITRMIVGGAQENTLFNCQDLVRDHGDEVFLLTGPSPGPEGELLQQVQPGGTQMITIPSLRRAIHPWHDWRAYRQIKKQLKRLQPDVVHTHSAKAGMLGRDRMAMASPVGLTTAGRIGAASRMSTIACGGSRYPVSGCARAPGPWMRRAKTAAHGTRQTCGTSRMIRFPTRAAHLRWQVAATVSEVRAPRGWRRDRRTRRR